MSLGLAAPLPFLVFAAPARALAGPPPGTRRRSHRVTAGLALARRRAGRSLSSARADVKARRRAIFARVPDDPRFDTYRKRMFDNAPALMAILEEAFLSAPARAWIERPEGV